MLRQIMRHCKEILANTSLVIATIGVFFLCGEAALRLTGIDTGRPRTPQIYRNSEDPRIGYELKPSINEKAFRSTVKTNSLGLRSPEPDPTKDTIAILGDSIAFGYGVENEEMLASQIEKEIESIDNVMTVAAPGYTLDQEIELYRKTVEQLHPKALILVFYWNDLDFTEPAVLDAAGNLQAPGKSATVAQCNPLSDGIMGWIPGRCWLDLHSAFYRTVKKIIVRRGEQRNLELQREESVKNPNNDPVTKEKIAGYIRQLEVFANTLPKNQKKIFVIWPEKQLHTFSAPILARAAERLGFESINLYDTFSNTLPTLSWDTVHPSAESISRVASIIVDHLR
jgi:lysophospholipase L1-like esterase